MCEMLYAEGVCIAAVCSSAAEVLRAIRQAEGALVFCGYKLRDATAEMLRQDLPDECPMAVLAQQPLLDQLEDDRIFGIAAPVRRAELLNLFEEIFEQQHAARVRPEEQRRLIEHAKEILMERDGLTEEQAHRFLQKCSMDHGERMQATAERILHEYAEQNATTF